MQLLFKIEKKLTITAFSREWLKRAKMAGKTVKWLAHLGKLFQN